MENAMWHAHNGVPLGLGKGGNGNTGTCSEVGEPPGTTRGLVTSGSHSGQTLCDSTDVRSPEEQNPRQ